MINKYSYSWICPRCNEDALVLSGNDYFTAFWFICGKCGLNSDKNYQIVFGEKATRSFNRAYERLCDTVKREIMESISITKLTKERLLRLGGGSSPDETIRCLLEQSNRLSEIEDERRHRKRLAKISYDELEDVLYVSFTAIPQKADFGEKYDDFIIRTKADKMVGVTILDASRNLRKLAGDRQEQEKRLWGKDGPDVRIRKVRVLQGRLRKQADKAGYRPNDLVIVTTTIKEHSLPTYKLEKIEGDPVSYLLKRCERGKHAS